MAEKETEFPKKSVAAAAALIGVAGAAYLGGQDTWTVSRPCSSSGIKYSKQEELKTYTDSIEQAVNANYDAKALVGEINVKQGDTLGDAGLEIVEHALGSRRL